MCLNDLLASMYVQHLCALCPWRLEYGIRSSGTEVTDNCELAYGC